MKRVLILAGLLMCVLGEVASAAELRIGIIGLDTSHVIAFTRSLNDASSPGHVPGAKVVAAFKGGSPDVPASATRVDKFTADLQSTYGVRIVGTIAELCDLVDAVLLESVDGRVHLEQAREVLRRRKPLFIDKPMAASLADAKEIARLAQESGTPWFSSSSLRFASAYQEFLADPARGQVLGVEAHGPASLEPTNPGLFWYGIHAVETLYTLMGPGCTSVTMTSNADYDLAVGVWKDGRIGTVKGLRTGKQDYGALVYGDKAVTYLPVKDVSYVPLVRQIVAFFQTGKPPVPPEETLEIMAFMDAAERSRVKGGVPTDLAR
ncbi:MAG TPA: Gfo/Idh/MocA family oxidoreductase [Vicinamibacterales bacterium]|nr:Gfo/Idh/MocA family oxidoreductase [Acidobacteriota bacterium]HOC17536.1 Gfo/Idh/MocA family oxidoreductase [Vicinamibacterales bacterium]